jgi:2,5-furandicarboxylate decarboxylase 1
MTIYRSASILSGFSLLMSLLFAIAATPVGAATEAVDKSVSARLNDLSACIDYLDKSGQLIRVKSEVDANLELTGIAKNFEGRKVVLFEKVKGYKYPVLIGLMWNRDILANIFKTPKENLPFRIARAVTEWQKSPMKTVTVDKGPANEVIKTSGFDLNDLPIPVHALKDGGKYFDNSVVIANNPDTGIPNASIHRIMVTGKDRLTLLLDRGRHLREYYEKMEKQGKPLHITINNGAGLAPWIVSIIPRNAVPNDKLSLAGHLLGEPLRVMKAQTVNTVALADAQFVIEGEMLPEAREDEGPFGEVAGYYGERAKRWVVKVTAITQRKNPVFHTLLPGKEVYNSVGLTGEANIFMRVSQEVPGVKAVYLSHGGSGFYNAVVQMTKPMEGLQKNAIMATFAAFPPLKMVTVVDEDVNIFSAEDVEWAVATRCDPERGIMFVKDAFGHELNPTTSPQGLTTKIGIDATVPFPRTHKYDRVKFKEVDLRNYEISDK